jgi:selenide, water dikinase
MRVIDWEKRRRVMDRSQALGHCICDPRQPCPCDVFRTQGLCPCAGERPEPVDLEQVKLTALVRNAGCASKIAPADLEAVLTRLPEVKDPAIVSGLATADDAAIYRISESLHLVQTVDVFTPCVDEPRVFGRICATNCLSDIYAMGGVPRTALSILCFPSETLPGEIMFQMMAGAMEVFEAAKVSLVGGHSVKDDEIKLGFAITGTIEPQVASRLERPQAGDVLVLTKPLGTGVLAFNKQIGRGHASDWEVAVASMCESNQPAAEAMIPAGASACTDITGFGLYGHLLRLVRRAGLSAEISASSLPALPGVLAAMKEGVIPGAMERNREFVAGDLSADAEVDEARLGLGFDAQTSGGLLIAVAPAHLSDLKRELSLRNVSAYPIGRLLEGRERRITVTNRSFLATTTPTTNAVNQPMTTPSASHHNDPDGCCCSSPGSDVSADLARSTASETASAFGEFMKKAQSAGVLSEKMKELILFGMVLQSRCAPCFEVHYRKALELGITPAELDEAAWCAVALGGAPVRLFYLDSLKKSRE